MNLNFENIKLKVNHKVVFDFPNEQAKNILIFGNTINFFGFFEGERMPIILSFGKTNFNEGKKLYSLAKVTMQNMWNYGYVLNEKLQAKGGNEWYIIVPVAAGASNDEDRAFAHELYTSFRNSIQSVNYDMDEAGSATSSTPAPDVEKTEF